MNINVQYYIGGDIPKAGFGVIGRSDNFHEDADTLWINHGSEIEERYRIEPVDYSQSDNLSRLCHVWEYQTDSFGVPAFIISYVGISNRGRFHGFAEYIMPELEYPVSQVATAGQMIDASSRLNTLDFYEFWETESTPIPPRNYVFTVRDAQPAAWTEDQKIDETWLLTLVSRYWESASRRAFSKESFKPVLVCLGEFAAEKQEDIDCTIEIARKFYVAAIASKLPAQVQNITSFAAGVDCRDIIDRLNSALLFCISENLNVEDALLLDEPKALGQYKLCPAEMNFIREAAGGKIPMLVAEAMKRYQELHPDANLNTHQIPFMSDYRVWYKLYCVEHLVQEGAGFLQQANLDVEENGEDKIHIRPARSCFLLMNELQRVFLDHEKYVKKTDADALLKGCEEKLLQIMLENLQSKDAKPFIVRPSEIRMWHAKLLSTPYDELALMMIQLLAIDQNLRGEKLNFVRIFPGTKINEATDKRNAAAMQALLENCIRPLIERERGKERIADESPLRTLGNDEFVNWACAYPKTRQIFHDFFADVVKDAELHFLLYGLGLTDGYLTYTELACNTIRIFTEKYSMPSALPPLKSRICAVLNDAAYFDNRPNENVSEAFTKFCIACFHHYGEKITALKPFFTEQKAFPVARGRVERTAQNNLSRYSTAPALIAIFREQEDMAEPMPPEKMQALWETLKSGSKGAERSQAASAFAHMLEIHRDRMLQKGKSPVRWLSRMLDAVPFEEYPIDTTDSLIKIFNAAMREAEKGDSAAWQMNDDEAAEAFAALGGTEGAYAKDAKVVEAYRKLIGAQRDAMLRKGESPVEKLQSMKEVAPFALDMTDSLVMILRDDASHAKDANASIPSVTDISNLFAVMYEQGQAASKNESVKAALLETVNAYRDVLLKHGTIPTHWLNDIWKVANEVGLAFDTSDSMAALFKYPDAHARMDVREASDVFDLLGEKADAMEEKVRPAFTGMVSEQLKAGLERDDESVIDWVCKMADLGGRHFTGRFNTSEWLTTIFKFSGSNKHPWLHADDAEACFRAMGVYASDLKGIVRNAYTAMLDRRIQDETRDSYDEDCFLWLKEMTGRKNILYAQDKNWLSDMHEKMIRLLTDKDYQDKEKLQIIAEWLDNDTVNRNGKITLQNWCNDALKAEKTESADALCSKFETIDARFETLRKYYNRQLAETFKNHLVGMTASQYGSFLSEYNRKMEMVGSSLNRLYDESVAETNAFTEKAFEHTSSIDTLAAIGKQIPGSSFKIAWQKRLNELFGRLQVGLFNDCRSLSEMQKLREEAEENGGLNGSLTAAYALLDTYDELLKQLIQDNEVQVLEDVGKIINTEIFDRLVRAEPVCENLCRCLKEQKHEAAEELEKRSFRHAVASWLMQAALMGKSDQQKSKRILWEAVLSNAVPSEELKKATRKPYERENLKVLQQLLALVDAVCCVNRFTLTQDWSSELMHTLRTQSAWKEYQRALSQKRKQGALYGLSFDQDGMLDFADESLS